MIGSGRRVLVAVGAILLPAMAQAHLVNTGLGPFYDGVSHLALTPEDLLLVVALALLAGQGGAEVGRAVLFALPAAWLLGGMTGLARPTGAAFPVIAWLSVMTSGLLIAAGARTKLVVALAVGFGLLHGYFNGAALAQSSGGALMLGGIVMTVFVAVAFCAAPAVAAKASWTRVVVRVAGSWISAIALLAIGWSLRRG